MVKDKAYYEKLAEERKASRLLKEPSSMAGLAAILAGLNEVFQIAEPSAVGAAVDAVATVVVNPSPMGIGMALFGLFSIFMKEKGGK